MFDIVTLIMRFLYTVPATTAAGHTTRQNTPIHQGTQVHALKGLALPRARYFSEIALSGSCHLRSTRGSARPVHARFCHRSQKPVES
jgi:hypothetical protein